MAVAQLLLKAFQLFSLRGLFFYHLSHLLELVPALGSIVFVSISNAPCLCIPSWQWQTGVVTVFMGWIRVLLYFRRLPVTGIYIVTFFDISRNVLKVLGLMGILLAGFGLALYMLFFDVQDAGVSWWGQFWESMSGATLWSVALFHNRGCRIPIHYAPCLL